MTLVAAIGCSDGVVMAADSATSDTEAGTKQPGEKIWQLRDQSILCGGAGDVGLLQKIRESLGGFTPKNSLKRVRQELKKLIVPELRESSEFHAPYPRAGFHEPPVAILLFAGVTNRQPWVLEVERDGRDTVYDASLGHFYAIGSGKPWAQAIFRPHLRRERDLRLGKVMAYRVVDDSIRLAAAGLSRPVRMWTVSIDGAVEQLDDNELKRLESTCAMWAELEAETVGRLLAEGGREQPEPGVPTPERSSS